MDLCFGVVSLESEASGPFSICSLSRPRADSLYSAIKDDGNVFKLNSQGKKLKAENINNNYQFYHWAGSPS